MDKAKKIAVALGLLTLPFFAGGWTQAQAQQQDEQLIVGAENSINGEVSLFDAYKDVENPDSYGHIYCSNYYIADSMIHYDFQTEQAGLMGTDRINYYFKTLDGAGPQVRIKVLYFWGNNTIKCGGEVAVGPFTVGSNAYTGTLWCDHGGVPSSSETSNKRWNCNFAAVSFQMKLGGEIKTEKFLINWDDETSDTYWTNDIYRTKGLQEKYLNMLSPWDNWN